MLRFGAKDSEERRKKTPMLKHGSLNKVYEYSRHRNRSVQEREGGRRRETREGVCRRGGRGRETKEEE